mmetsp:Transcript_32374/g.73085  ORF Transcript_32374/g.73085 Transcript_32374/m.73085 type:complete len:100 (-) Transcript_32374:776-1075(-)
MEIVQDPQLRNPLDVSWDSTAGRDASRIPADPRGSLAKAWTAHQQDPTGSLESVPSKGSYGISQDPSRSVPSAGASTTRLAATSLHADGCGIRDDVLRI